MRAAGRGCGIAAKAALAERIEGQTLQCVVLAEDRDGWYVSRCVGEHGADLGAYMVRSGLALAATDDYRAEQATPGGAPPAPGKARSCPPGSGARTAADAQDARPAGELRRVLLSEAATDGFQNPLGSVVLPQLP
jgi:hypothetical protein